MTTLSDTRHVLSGAAEFLSPNFQPPHATTPSTSTVLQPLRRLRWIHLPIILVMTAIGLASSWARMPPNGGDVHLIHLLYLLSVPYVVLGIAGLLTPADRLPAKATRRLDRLIICLVTKGKAPEVVRRTYQSLLSLCGPRVELCVVTDAPLDVPHLLVPPTFRTRHGRYKARALEYFRRQQHFGPGDWVLHLDEESVIDEHGLRACIDFCERSPYLYGQGPIFYNNHEFWRRPILTAADCIRAADDVGKFHLQLAALHRPIFGLHGSFLLAKGSLEDEITWDLRGSLVEDYAFAVECMRRGYGVGAIDGIVREQSPKSIMDFLRQRRRWLVGIRGLSALSPWARLWSVLWSASPLVKSATVLDVMAARQLSWELIVAGNFFASTFLYLYLLGSVLQDLDRGTRLPRLVWRAFLTALLFPVSYLLENLAVLWSFVSRERHIGFQVVHK